MHANQRNDVDEFTSAANYIIVEWENELGIRRVQYV